MHELAKKLDLLKGKGYKAYKTLAGKYSFENFELTVDHVQSDPFATPTRISLTLPHTITKLPAELWSSKIRKIALEDYIGRQINSAISRHCKGQRGSGNSGKFYCEVNGQEVILRNAILLFEDHIEARLTIGLPGSGRSIEIEHAREMLCTELPLVVHDGLLFENYPDNKASQHIESVEDQEFLRSLLTTQKLVAFVATNASLARHSGIDDRPMAKCDDSQPVLFQPPPSMEKTFDLPNAGKISGMAIPEGITLIVGGGFHGKSTLLRALEKSVYNHIIHDGREKTVTVSSAVKIRAEDGRSITNVNISPFIHNLPLGKNTSTFTTQNASGSTSQAANIIEALQCKSTCLLIDEDTSATNFMIRDQRMQQLVSNEKEPITPLLFRVRELYLEHGISSVIVMGGSGDYLDVADRVIMMDNYIPVDVSEKARTLRDTTAVIPTRKHQSSFEPGHLLFTRSLLNAQKKPRDYYVRTPGDDTLLYGRRSIDVSCVEQLLNHNQLRTIGLLLHYIYEHSDSSDSITEHTVQKLLNEIMENGLDLINPYKTGDLAMPRIYEIASVVNRIRPLI